ncbi:hypothetical protein GCM10010398_69800 [Streptomyces fimbriatus]
MRSVRSVVALAGLVRMRKVRMLLAWAARIGSILRTEVDPREWTPALMRRVTA